MKRIAIIGTGNMASALGRRMAESGFDIVFGSRDPNKSAALAADIGQGARGTSIAEAGEAGDAVLFTVPHESFAEVAQTSGPLSGKLVIEVTNTFGPGFEGLTVDPGTSATEILQRLLPEANVVKAFNTLFAAGIADGRYFEPKPYPAYFAGDDGAACEQFAAIARAIGLEPAYVGSLSAARFLEGFAVLIVALGYVPVRPEA